MGIHTRVYELEGQLAINIPTQVLPEEKIQLVEEIVTIPGYEAELERGSWYYTTVYTHAGRTALVLSPYPHVGPRHALEELGLDPIQPISIRLYGSNKWIDAHKYHWESPTTRSHGRVWIPKDVIIRTKLQDYTTYPVKIRGITLPVTTKRIVRKRVRNVIISHFNREYSTDNYAINRWRWIIPDHIICYPILKRALELGVTPECECHLVGGIIQVDFIFSDVGGKFVSRDLTFAYRNLRLKNYSVTLPEELDYPMLCEIRVFIHMSCPKEFFQDLERYMLLDDALGISLHNVQMFFTQSIQHAIKKEKLKKGDKISITEGDEINKKVSYGETEGYRYGYCEKYIRILNRAGTWEYHTERIDSDLRRNKNVVVDSNGFIWMASI